MFPRYSAKVSGFCNKIFSGRSLKNVGQQKYLFILQNKRNCFNKKCCKFTVFEIDFKSKKFFKVIKICSTFDFESPGQAFLDSSN